MSALDHLVEPLHLPATAIDTSPGAGDPAVGSRLREYARLEREVDAGREQVEELSRQLVLAWRGDALERDLKASLLMHALTGLEVAREKLDHWREHR